MESGQNAGDQGQGIAFVNGQNEENMYYSMIKYCDIANGLGVRTSLFVSGCTHRCRGCFNEAAWDFEAGEVFTGDVEEQILESLKPEYIAGLSLLGGEPMEIVNQRVLVRFLRKVKAACPQKNIWCYTGYTYPADFQTGARANCEVTREMLSYIDVLVDGEFIGELYDIGLKFRGSSNQRLIDLKESEKQKGIVELKL